jgi:hypothetical protein
MFEHDKDLGCIFAFLILFCAIFGTLGIWKFVEILIELFKHVKLDFI